MRVLVTGSRTWKDGNLIRAKLSQCLDTCRETKDSLTIVHGGCRSGADAYADAWSRWHQRNITDVTVKTEPHPARWEAECRDVCQPHHRRPDKRGWTVCPAAGFYRNEDMVHLGADLVLAFIADDSKGATHCARYAESAGLSVLYFTIHTSALF